MPKFTIEIGGTPAEEDCASIGSDQPPENVEHNRLECRAYIAALRVKYGAEPDGARLRIQDNSHEFGTYREVVIDYDSDLPMAAAYAAEVENGLTKWADADFWKPVLYDDDHRALHVITDPELWSRRANPQAYSTKRRD